MLKRSLPVLFALGVVCIPALAVAPAQASPLPEGVIQVQFGGHHHHHGHHHHYRPRWGWGHQHWGHHHHYYRPSYYGWGHHHHYRRHHHHWGY